MSEEEPKRLLHGGGSNDARALLEAGKSDVPTDGQMLMLAAKIGIVGGMGGAGAAGAAAGTGAGAGAKGVFAIKVIGVIAVASAAGAGAVMVTRHSAENAVAPHGLVATATATATATASEANTTTAPTAEVSAETAASAKVPAKTGPPTTVSAPVRDEGPQAEVELVQQAKSALASNPAQALALCNDHAKRFPNGMFVQEREAVAIEALVKTGRRDEAVKRADRFKSRYPGSSLIRRIDVVLGT